MYVPLVHTKIPKLVAVTCLCFAAGVLAAAPVQAQVQVPAQPERTLRITADSLERLYRFENLVFDHPRMSGPYPRNLLVVGFHPAATREERQAAIDLSGGEYIGGEGLMYYVLIRDDGTADPLWRAIDRLRLLSQVAVVHPEIFRLGVVPA